jgi:hypothetical protein
MFSAATRIRFSSFVRGPAQSRPRENQSPVASSPKITVGQITHPALTGTSQRDTAQATNAHLAAIKIQAQTMKREIRG